MSPSCGDGWNCSQDEISFIVLYLTVQRKAVASIMTPLMVR